MHAVEVVEACGRLPLAVAIAGGIVSNYGSVDADLVWLVRQEVQESGSTVEESVISASLRSLQSAEESRVGQECRTRVSP